MPEGADSWHDAISTSLDKAADAPAEVVPEEAPKPEGVFAEDAPEEAAKAEAKDAKAEAEAKAQRQRDEKGRFAPKAEPKEAPKEAVKPAQIGQPVVPPPAPPPDPKPQAEPLRAPQSLKPAEREEFAKAPRAIQEAMVRREREVQSALQETAEARKGWEQFRNVVQPYEHMFRASGRQPVEAVGWLVQQYAALQTAPLPQRAQIIGGLLKDFLGTDEAAINLLAQAVEGKAGAQPAAAPYRPEEIQALVRKQLEAERAEQARQTEMTAIQEFEATEPEFLGDVTQEIFALATIEKRNGKPLTKELLNSLYERAIRINPETSKILAQREAAKAAQSGSRSTQRAEVAASSVRSQPGGEVKTPPGDSWAEHLNAAFERL